MLDLNLANAAANPNVIPFEARAPILGFNIPEAVLLANTGRSLYNSLQVSFMRRMYRACSSTCPIRIRARRTPARSTPAARPAAASQTHRMPGSLCRETSAISMRTTRLSDFDRPHRFSTSFIYELPGFARGFRVSGFVQMQSGLPYSIYAAEPEIQTAAQYTNLVRGSGGIYRAAFGRPSLCGSLDDLRQAAPDPTQAAFNASVLCSPSTIAGGYPDNQGFGNLGRNLLRGFWQKRVDLSLARNFRFGANSGTNFELRWDVFNVFNNVNYALPENVIGDPGTDFGQITNTVGGPRVMQFGFKVTF